jgi:hypothetical protein
MSIQVFGNNKVGISELGGIAVKLNNGSGVASVKGTIVKADVNADDSFDVGGGDEAQPIGIVYDDGIADGSECWVILAGVADVLLKDTTLSTHGNWVHTSDVAGRADATLLAPPGGGIPELDNHMQEIGHALETKVGDTNVLARVCLHFN